jgi:Zn-dependent M28 family amino/carboxypeptidase
VFIAHLDYLGLGAEVNRDAIYSGALDNALGVGLLLETARLAQAGPATARGRLYFRSRPRKRACWAPSTARHHPCPHTTPAEAKLL